MDNKKPYKILSLDGGGVKAIQQAIILNYIEKKTGKQIYQLFDLISGTSAGGINALLLANGYSAESIVNFYIGEEIKSILLFSFPIRFLIGIISPSAN